MDISLEKISLYLIFFLPGLISLRLYSFLMPTVKKSVTRLLFDGLFYTCLNILILLPTYAVLFYNIEILGFWTYIIFYSLILIVSVGWPILLNYLVNKTDLLRNLQLPFPTAWDYFFNKRETCFMLFHLNDGSKIGGYYGEDSFSCSYPRHGDIYIETVYEVNEDGTFGDYIKDSKGLLLARENYKFVEIFRVPNQ